jgi:hypothetical protein
MRRGMTWWRNLSGLVAACVLALLVVAPTASMAGCVCGDTVRLTTSAVVEAVQDDHRDDRSPCEAPCCVGGHCHHAGPLLDTPVATVPVQAPVAAAHALAPARALASQTLSGPDRPPRA